MIGISLPAHFDIVPILLCVTNRKAADPIPYALIGPSVFQPLTEMSTRDI